MSRPAVTHFNWRNKALAKAYTNQLVTAFEDDPVDAWFSPKATHAYVKHEVKGYLKALPDAQHFVATEDGACIALWQLLPQESPKNEFWAGWQRIFQVPFCLWKATVDMEFMYEERHERLADELQGGHYYLSYIGE